MSLKYINGRCTTVFPKGNSSVAYINGRAQFNETVKPRLSSAVTQSATRVRLTFNEPMSATGIDDTSHYSFSGAGQGTGPAVIDHIHINSTTEIDLDLTGEMTTGTANYSVAVIHVTDTIGNVIDPSYDDATFNGIGVAPQVVSATVIDSTHIDVLFNEAMEQTTMDTAGHYTITGDATPAVSAAAHSSTTVVRLTTDAMADGNYSVGVIHCTDLVGNVIDAAHDDAAFTVALSAWYVQTLAGVTTGEWVGATVSADGTFTVACNQGTHVYTSPDVGANWTERNPAGGHANWTSVASDADGSNLIACVVGGRVYTSSNSGANWTAQTLNGVTTANWYSVASDSDGTNLIVCDSGTHVYTSSDSGANWTERDPAGGDVAWRSVASDSDGTNLIACVNGTRVYTSSNSGANWTERDPAGGDVAWRGVASDADGSNLIACAYNGRVYISTDSGEHWTAQTLDGVTTARWYAVASDSTGTILMAATDNALAYVSVNGGTTWTSQTFPGPITNAPWQGLGISSDGKIRTACCKSSGRVFVYK